MSSRLLLIIAFTAVLASQSKAGSVRVNFSAELDRHHAALDPVTTVRGHFVFDETTMVSVSSKQEEEYFLPNNPFFRSGFTDTTDHSSLAGMFTYANLLEFTLETSSDTASASEGLIVAMNEKSISGEENSLSDELPLIKIFAGSINNPASFSRLADLDGDGEVSDNEFSETVTYLRSGFSDGFLWTWEPLVEFVLSPSVSEMIIYQEPVIDRNHTATYRITSLIVVPEPGTLLLVLSGVGLAIKTPRRDGGAL